MQYKNSDAINILSRTPDALNALYSGLSEPWLRCREKENGWTPYQIVGHLIHGEHTDWIPRVRMILEHGESKTFEPFDREFMLRLPQDRPVADMLAEFKQLRTENLATLGTLVTREDQAQLRGMHPGLGSVTLGQLLATWVAHDLTHLSQITRIMARQYRDAVGPWLEYLPLLND